MRAFISKTNNLRDSKMKITVTESMFVDYFQKAGRENNFSSEGFEVLFQFIQDYENDTGEEIELDVIALCCEYVESSYEEIVSDYCIDVEDSEDEESIYEAVKDYLEHNTMIVGEVEGGFIYQVF